MRIEDWGQVDLTLAVDRQLALVHAVREGKTPDTLVFCWHPPVVTCGRGTQPGDIDGWNGPVVEVSRGGRATYHGPGQVVMYPILDLKRARTRVPPGDVHAYLACLERVTAEALRALGLPAQASRERGESRADTISQTGVWLGHRKVASLGIAVSRGVSYHGVAVNVSRDPLAFQGMKPCGFSTDTMISLEEYLGRKVSHADVQQHLQKVALAELSSQGPE